MNRDNIDQDSANIRMQKQRKIQVLRQRESRQESEYPEDQPRLRQSPQNLKGRIRPSKTSIILLGVLCVQGLCIYNSLC